MKKGTFKFAILAMAVIFSIGCASTVSQIRQRSQSVRNDVFSEAKEGVTPQGWIDFVVKASLKTHTEEWYLLESKKSLHGKTGYPFVLNMDGQAAEFKIDGVKENVPVFDASGDKSPEGGEGVRYVFEKRIVTAPGVHRIAVILPNDRYFREVTARLNKGDLLEFRPIYQKDEMHDMTFLSGISSFEVYLNGQLIK